MDEEQLKTVDRKKRVQRLKKMIIISLMIGILVPWIACMILFVYVRMLKTQMAGLSDKAEALEQVIGAQTMEIDELKNLLENIGEELHSLSQDKPQDETEGENGAANAESLPEEDFTAQSHKVYLTFDDGPSSNTAKILDILKEYDVKATFFVLGKEGDGDKEALKRIVEEGHALGMHSYTHRYEEIYASKESFGQDFMRLRDYLQTVTGVTSRLYRFPGGSSNSVTNTDIHEFIDFLAEMDTPYFDWNVASGDAAQETLSAQTIFLNSIEGIESRPVSVILFHDAVGRETTVEALPMVIERILQMDNTQILPLTPESEPVQHVKAAD